MLEAVRRRGQRMAPVVYASSIAASPAADDYPSTLYGVFKLANEGTAARYAADYGVPSVGLRPHTIYGPGRDQGSPRRRRRRWSPPPRASPYEIPFGGSVQFQYAADAGEAFVRASEADGRARACTTSTARWRASRRSIAAIERAAPEAAGPITFAGDPLPFPESLDSTSFTDLVGGPTARPLEEGVAEAIARFRA